MAIPRSKSAPLLDIPSRTLNDTHDAGTRTPPVWAHPRRTKQRLALTTASLSSPLRSPIETPCEDPFNMGGFFPAHVSTLAEEDEEWSWLHQDGDEQSHPPQGRYPLFSPVESEEDQSVPATPQSLEFGLEDQARKVLQEEDKLGILTFGDMFVAHAQSRPDEHLLSPYAGDQPENDDALYNGLRALRCAHSVPSEAKTTDELSELFLPEDQGEGARQERISWMCSLSGWLWG